jgi:3',5'-nucleoside bisphosphate phosphatase
LETVPSQLVLAPNAAIDLQMHTIYSDGVWTPEQLIDHLVSEQFGLAAITDHDRVDTIAEIQHLAAEKHLPVLAAVEMSTSWKGEATDVLCYGFDPAKNVLKDLTEDITRRQQENTWEVYENLRNKGLSLPDQHELLAILEKPSAQQPIELAMLLEKQGYGTWDTSAWKMIKDAGHVWATNDIAAVVDAAHRSGAVCLIAHPGRGEGWINYDGRLLDELRQNVPIDGFEVYYPAHTPKQIAIYLQYAQKHHLLTSSGSDSHGPDKKPIKYRAELSRNLLERVGIQIK